MVKWLLIVVITKYRVASGIKIMLPGIDLILSTSQFS